MNLKTIDYTDLFKKYAGSWVALEDDEKTVISQGKTAKEALDKAVNEGYESPILFKVPSKSVSYVG